MSFDSVNITIVGAGIVGLAIGNELSEYFDDVLVLEKENGFGKHTSSRNSEVIHSGIYYPKNSLKAELCLKGNKLLYEFADKYGVNYDKCGKFIVATTDEEIPELEKLKAKGILNGVKGLEILNKEEVGLKIPDVKSVGALWVPDTGIVDSHRLMQNLEMLIEKKGGMIAYNTEVNTIKKLEKGFELGFTDGSKLRTNILINAAGLFSENISKMLGVDTEELNLKLHLCKGEYYKTTKIKGIKHLIYPLPDPKGIFLGIHLTLNLQGDIRFGPNAYYVDELDYKMDTRYKQDFVDAISRYMDIDPEHLQPDDVGMRAKLQGPNDGFRDFHIKEEKEMGLSKYINLTGIESPGLTSALAIAKKVNDIVKHNTV